MSLGNDIITRIESTTKDILNSAYSSENLTPPIDLNRILTSYGMTVRTGPFEDPSISGAYDRNQRTIYISDSESPQRQAFTIAHELGHYFLHEDKQNEIFYRLQAIQFGQEKPIEEKEADWFASSLLMPAELVKPIWTIVKNIDQLAALFGVSSSAARWRLVNLGIL